MSRLTAMMEILTPKAATATTKENDTFALEVSPHGCAVLAR
jgi:hypothetical protein